MTPQAIIKIRFSEEAEAAGVRYTVRSKKGTPDRLWYLDVQYDVQAVSLSDLGPRVRESYLKATQFVAACFPKAWITSGSTGNDVYGLPGQAVEQIVADAELDPACLSWNDSAVVRIARGVRDRQAFAELPVIGDALEEAGCQNHVIIDHCRANAPHGHVCWVVELLVAVGRKPGKG